MLAEIYLIIGVLYGIIFLYKEVRPGLGMGTAILFAGFILPVSAFIWPLLLLSELPKAEKK
jgi:hypothetical protein